MKLEMPLFQNARILVVGDVMLDRYWHGRTSRISPEAPVPVVRVGNHEDRPGGAANVALNIAALGGAATLTGIVGKDDAGDELTRRLSAAGVLSDCQMSASSPTITKLRVISQNQQLLRVDFEEAFAEADVAAMTERALQALEGQHVLVLSDYGKGTLRAGGTGATEEVVEKASSGIQALIQAARERGIPVVVDPKGTEFERYRGATVITPNLAEFEAVVGHCQQEDTLVQRGEELRKGLDLQALLITRGENGMTLLRDNAAPMHLPAQAQEVFDVTGAGDTVVSVLAAALGAGQTLDVGTQLANVAAGLVVGKLGTAAISGPELRRAVQQQDGTGRGVMTADQLVAAVEDARAQGERIVFTNGCFDIIHAGHVGYLADARKEGDRLVVAINDDASVTRLKGPGRPINPVERRMIVLAGLEAVDWVVRFAEDTPEELLQRVRPDVLVKGGDYGVDEVIGGEFVRSYGGEVRVLDFLDNCSTSAIVEKVRQGK